ncbi:MAG: GAF domain-containing protein, partial [Planctomycetota bacterium]
MERKKMEEALQQANSLLAATIESAADGILVVDSQGKVTTFNQKYLALWRVPESLARTKNDDALLDYVLSQLRDPDGFIEKVKQLYSQPEADGYDLLEFKDGRVFERFSRPQRLNERIVGRVLSFRDATDRKWAKDEQLRSQAIAEIGRLIGSTLEIDKVYERFAVEARKLIPFDRLAVNLHNPHKRNVEVAYTFGEEISGRSKGNLFPLKDSVSEVLTKTRAGLYLHLNNVEEMDQRFPKHVATIQAGMRSLMGVPLIYRNEVIGSLHFRSKTPNAYTEHDLRLAERIGAQIAGAIGTAQLFSDLKRMKEESDRYSRQLAMLHETSVELTAELNLETLLQSIARRALDLIGGTTCNVYIYRPENDLMERAVSIGPELVPSGTTRRRGEGVAGKVLATGASMVVNDYRAWPGRIKAYDSYPSRAVVAVPFYKGTEILGVINIMENLPHQYTQADVDILGMFATQAAIAIHNARLYDKMRRDLEERRRLEGERKAIQAQLLQSQKMEAIGTLAGGIAHDFNNILMGIQGYLSLIQMDLPSNHPHYFRFQGIEEQIGSGASLTKQLLGFAREGKYEVKPTNLNMILKNSYEIFAPTHKEISVSRSLQEGLWPAEVDRKQIEQVLLNLFINSWQAMPEGGDLYLETQNVVLSDLDVKPHGVQPGRYVKISVTDTGTGMDESTRARIFEPFFTTKRPGKGTGLGLASVYGIMNN